MSKLDVHYQLRAWDCLHVLNIQFLELSLVLGCILFIKQERATNQAHELSWASACMLGRDRLCLTERNVYDAKMKGLAT